MGPTIRLVITIESLLDLFLAVIIPIIHSAMAWVMLLSQHLPPYCYAFKVLGKLHVTQKTSYSLGHHICKSGHKSVYGITPFSFQLTHTFIDLSVSHSKCHRSTRQLRKPSKLGWVDCQMKSCVPSKPFGGHGCVLGIELTSTLDAYFT